MADATRACDQCNKPFESRWPKQRNCSKLCGDLAKRRPIELTCEGCGKRYIRSGSFKARRFCSRACVTQGTMTSKGVAIAYTDCLLCGRLFCHPAKRKRVYCSQACMVPGRGLARRVAMVRRVCEFCGAEFERYPSQVKPGKDRGKFCSRSCAGLGRPIDFRPSWIATASIAEWASRGHRPIYVEELRFGWWSVDLAFPLDRLAVELDGCYWHSLPAMVDRDRRKDAALAAEGWTVRRIVMEKDHTPADVADLIDAVAGIPRSRRRRRRRSA